MLTLNLTPNFLPFGEGMTDASTPFPSGIEANFRLNEDDCKRLQTIDEEEVMITCRFENGNDLMRILIATNALRNLKVKNISLFIPFLPYGRQDRVCRIGEGFSLKIFAGILNSQNYLRVVFFDIHSIVASALIDRSENVSSTKFIEKVLENKNEANLVSPDAGAAKRVYTVSNQLGNKKVRKVVQCLKHRDIGGLVDEIKILETDFEGQDLYIIDDICDGGATFIHLAKALKAMNCGKIILVVSHGIFSRGLNVLRENGIDHVYTTDSFKAHEENDFLSVVKMSEVV